MTITREQIEAIASDARAVFADGHGVHRIEKDGTRTPLSHAPKTELVDLCRLALLGLAVRESGVTADDLAEAASDGCDADYAPKLRAIAEALREAGQ